MHPQPLIRLFGSALAVASLGLLQACGSDGSSYNTLSPSSNDDTSLSGAELYSTQCVSCHGETGNGNTPINNTRSASELSAYIASNMPKDNTSACDTVCADKVSAFILAGYNVTPAMLSQPTFKLDEHEHGNSYKVLAGFSSLQWADGANHITTVDSWQWLYTYTNDTPEQSTCDTEACLSQWQPLLTTTDAKLNAPFGMFERSEGHWQASLYGMPLYTKSSAASPPVQSPSWPIATPTPTLQNNNWLQVSGLLDTQSQHATTLDALSLRSTYIKTSDGPCTGACLDNWPAILIPADLSLPKPYSLQTTDNAALAQLAYQGQTLHLFSADTSGDAIGADINGWQRTAITPIRWQPTTQGNTLAVDGSALVWRKTDNSWESREENVNGYSLYTFANDGDFSASPNTAMLACNGACAEAWPPLMAHPNSYASGKFGLMARGDSMQWSWNGKPLYLYSGDTSAAQATGHNPQGLWTLAGWQAPENSPADTPMNDRDY